MNTVTKLTLCLRTNEIAAISWERWLPAGFSDSTDAAKLAAFPGRFLQFPNLGLSGISIKRALHWSAPTRCVFVATWILLLVLLIIPSTQASAKNISSITNPSTLFDVQQAYGKKVQAKTKVNKFTSSAGKSFKTNKFNKANPFKSKSFYNSKAALKEFQVQFKVGNSFNVTQFGAKGDGVTDNQSAITQAINRAQGTGLSVYFPPGNYLHSGLIVSNGVALYGAGASTILTATNSANGAIELTGNGPSLSQLVVQYANPVAAAITSYPNTAPQADAVWVQSANNFAVYKVTMLNSSQNNIDVFQSNNGSVSSNQMITTSNMFDGMQIIDCNNVRILGNNFLYDGKDYDDLVVLYGSTGSQNLTIAYNQLQAIGSNPHGIGMYLTGLQSSSIDYNYITNGNTGVQIRGIDLEADAGGFGYGPVSNVVVAGNKLIDGNISNTSLSIILYDESFTGNYLNNVQIIGNTITNTYYAIFPYSAGSNINIAENTMVNSASPIYGEYFGINNSISFNTIINSGGDAMDIYDYSGASSITITSNTVDTVIAGNGIYCSSEGGTFIIQNNTLKDIANNGIYFNANSGSTASATIFGNILSNCCVTSGNVIEIPSGGGTVSSLTVQNNYYGGPANNATYYVESLVLGSATNPNISGNTQATALPNNLAP